MSFKPAVLFVDDEEKLLTSLKILSKNRYRVWTATNAVQALDIIAQHKIHVVVSDQRMPGMSGIELLREVRRLSPRTMRIVLTGYADLEAMVGSINEGEVYRYIYKPWNNTDLAHTLDAAADAAMAQQADDACAPALAPRVPPGILVLDDEPGVRRAVEQLFAGRCRVWPAASCAQALDILEREPIGVIVSEVYVAHQDVTPLIKVLKQRRPCVVTVVATRFNDPNMVVGLINHAQVFRFLDKPLSQASLGSGVEAALAYHAECRRQPQLLLRHTVERFNSAEVNPNFAAALMNRVRSLGRLPVPPGVTAGR